MVFRQFSLAKDCRG